VHDLGALGVEFSLGAVPGSFDAETVLHAVPRPVVDPAVAALRDSGVDVRVIGDAASIGFVEGAMSSAREVAIAIAAT
jgi:hypothetical protein